MKFPRAFSSPVRCISQAMCWPRTGRCRDKISSGRGRGVARKEPAADAETHPYQIKTDPDQAAHRLRATQHPGGRLNVPGTSPGVKMRFAAIADVHGNPLALEAVIADIRAEGIDDIVNLGDMASGPLDAGRTVDALMALGATS